MTERKILIVDDEAAIRTLLRAALSGAGLSVFEADCGANALTIATDEAPFDLVVSDVLMPGMDGIELAKKLTAAGHAKRFLFVSGYCDQDSMADRTRQFPASAFLAKPFSIPELLRTFRALMAEEPESAHTASLRSRPARSALRRQLQPIEVVRALRRRAGRLRVQQDQLLEDTAWALRERALLLSQIKSQYAAIGSIARRLPTHRAML